jgi:uncharacterized protein YkwD
VTSSRTRAPVLLSLLAVLCAALLLAAGQPAAAAIVGDCAAATSWPQSRPDLATEVVQLVNAHRASRRLATLAVSTSLTRSADWKARHMAAYRYLAHNDPAPPVTRTVGQRLAACGYGGGTYGENIAYGYPSASSVVTAWLRSPGHRTNIENRSFTAIGVGVATAANGTIYWAQNFGVATGTAAPPATQPAPTQPAPPRTQPPPAPPTSSPRCPMRACSR